MHELRTERLLLRPVIEADAADLRALWDLPPVRRHLFDDRPVTWEQTIAFIRDSELTMAWYGRGLWALLEDSRLVGACGLKERDHGAIELLYSLDPRRWGQGLAREASAAILAHAFGTLGYAEVVAEVNDANAASIGLAQRLGMHERSIRQGAGGVLRLFVLPQDEWNDAQVH